MKNPVDVYIKILTFYLNKKYNISYKECSKFIANEIFTNIRDKSKKENIPLFKILKKNKNGDMEEQLISSLKYIEEANNDNDVIVPSLTRYKNPKEEKSELTDFILTNLKDRSKAKKEALKYKIEGDKEKADFYNNYQKSKKINNNALSGVFATKSTALYNPSAHYTLTSITRMISSIGNLITEKFVSGNRLYKHPDIVITDMIYIIRNMEYEKDNFKKLMQIYNIHIITKEELISILKKSSDKWFSGLENINYVIEFIDSLTDIERCLIAYVNDFYHFRKYNDKLCREIFDKFSNIELKDKEYTMEEIKKYNEEYYILSKHILFEDLKGVQNLEKDKLNLIGSTVDNIDNIFKKYKELFNLLFFNKLNFLSISSIKDMVRECIVLSDTDSTCGTYQEWVEWYTGEIKFNRKSMAVAASVMTMVGFNIKKQLYYFSKQMNVSKELLNMIGMKNEFFWYIMCPMNLTKHYYASIMIQEGNVLKDIELELKGVHLIASQTGSGLSDLNKKNIKENMNKIIKGEKISLVYEIKYIIEIEKFLYEKIMKGDPNVFNNVIIKDKDSYKQDEDMSKYRHFIRWNKCFKHKYGKIEDPPWVGLKLSVDLTTNKKIKQWLETIEDKKMKEELTKEFGKKPNVKMFILPKTYVIEKGIPDEILRVIDWRNIILENLRCFYLTLEGYGFYKKENYTLMELNDELPKNF